MLNRIAVLWQNQEGATRVEFAIMLALFAVACLLLLKALGLDIGEMFYNAQSHLPAGNGLVQPTP